MSSSRRGVAALLAASAALAISGPAVAAPAPFESLPFVCDGLGSVRLTSPGGGPFTPGFIDGSHALFVPYDIDITTSSVGGTESTDVTKGGPIPSDAITCNIDTTIHVGGIAYTIVGSVIGSVRGQG